MILSREQAQIKLDLDKKSTPRLVKRWGPDLYVIRRRVERAGYRVLVASVQLSPGKNGWHVVLEVLPRPTHPMEVIALQAICGSDPYREATQMHRGRAFQKAPIWMRDAWNVLYSPDVRRHRRIQLKGV